jgi:beta-alanine degradation protein BauB
MADEGRELGDVATKLLMENDRVRIWEMRLEPGARSALHRHDHDYIMVQIAGDRMAADFEPDSQDGWGAAGGRVEGDISPGNVLYAAKGGIETAINVGREPFHEIVIELKA